jgi:DNA polymerase III alpha subunit
VEALKLILNQRKSEYPILVSHPNFEKRLKWEIIETDVQDEESYFLNMFEKQEKKDNPHNLLIPVLLGICDSVDLDSEPAYRMGDFPDVDVDYLPVVRDYLKKEWAPKQFGEANVCSIGNYGTFGLKSSLIDMVRVHGLDRNEIMKITTNMGLKDDEGQSLTMDKALEIYPELQDFCTRHPEIEKAVRKLLHRNRSMGKHAGGLIISNGRIDDFVPLVRGTDGTPVSAWVEGLHGQDLGPVGLIKFDLLVVDGLNQIATATRYVKQRHNIDSVCALPGDWDWSDTSYLNDPESLAMANDGDLKCIFQYDSDGIRALATKGGVDTFDDLVAYVSLYRPSCLQMKMDEEYVERKHGRRQFEVPKILEPYLGKTYSVMIYQEQVMQVLNVVGKIPLRDCYQVIKAISKKKIEAFKKYKEKFVENGQQILGKSEKEMEEYWDLVQSFSGYGFNFSHAVSYSYISARQLYLKSHYPLEFFVSSLQSQDNDEKRRDYITEAINHGVEVMPLTLNKSRETFDIVDEKIYVGFGNIKGIGEDKAKRIAEMQPYSGLKDFMDRYGTEAGTLKPLIGLRIFGDNILELYAYYLKYVEFRKQVKDKEKRFETKCKETFDILKSLLPEKMRSSLERVPKLTTELFDVILNYLDKKGFDKKSDVVVAVSALAKKFSQALGRYNAGLEKAQEPKLGELNIEDCTEADDKLVNLYKSVKECELAYYGFLWTNDVKKSSKYKAGFNFDIAKRKNLSRPQPYYLVFGIIQSCQIKSFKSGKGKFASVELIDENMHIGRVTVWEDDYNIFKDDLSKGNLVSMQVTVSQGFQGFTLYGPPKHKRHALPARQYDTRVVVLEESSDG